MRPKQKFTALLDERDSLDKDRKTYFEALENALDSALINALQVGGKRVRKTRAENIQLLGVEGRRIHDDFFAQGEGYLKSFYRRQGEIKGELIQVAELCEIAISPSSWILYATVWGGSYKSAGSHYARGEAEMIVEHLRSLGVEAKVESVENGFQVLAGVVNPIDCEIARRKPGLPLREWVRLCWAKGLNPRVFNPFLPHGFEARAGLDYSGNFIERRVLRVGVLYCNKETGGLFAHPEAPPEWQQNFHPPTSFHVPLGSKKYVPLTSDMVDRLARVEPETMKLHAGEYMIFRPPIEVP